MPSKPGFGDLICITDPPGASIYLDNILQPQLTPATIIDIINGQHTITFIKSGYEIYTHPVVIKSGKTSTISVNLASQKFGDILIVTEPPGANIYLDGIIQQQQTPSIITVNEGKYNLTLTKAGYTSYTQIVDIKKNTTTTVATILSQIVDITDSGVVICSNPNVTTCPMSLLSCPIIVAASDYINLMVILWSTASTPAMVRFTYTLNDVINYADVSTTLMPGTNIVYAFTTNVRYSGDTILSLDDVTLI
jgi:hypothetical protein